TQATTTPSKERKMVLIAGAAASRGRSRKRMRAVKAPRAKMPPIHATRAAVIAVSMSGSHFFIVAPRAHFGSARQVASLHSAPGRENPSPAFARSFAGHRAKQVLAVGLAGGDEREH